MRKSGKGCNREREVVTLSGPIAGEETLDATRCRDGAMTDESATIPRFFSVAGRASIPRFWIVAVAVAAILWACGQTTWEYGRVANGFIGAVAGTAGAKLVVEAVRRLRDASVNLRLAAWCALGAGSATAFVFASFFFLGLQIAQAMLSFLTYAVPIIAAVALSLPSRAQPATLAQGSAKRGLPFAITCTVRGSVDGNLARLLFDRDERSKPARDARADWTARERQNAVTTV